MIPNTGSQWAQDPSELLQFQSVLEELRGQEDSATVSRVDQQHGPARGEGDSGKSSTRGGTRNPQDSDVLPALVSRNPDQSVKALNEIEAEFESINDTTELASTSSNVDYLAKSVLEFSRDAVAVLSGLKIVYCNRLAESLFGIDRQKQSGENLLRVVLRNFAVDQKQLRNTIKRLNSGKITEQEVRREGSDKSVWYEIRLKRFQLENQERIVVMARDISRRKQYELELARSRDFLNNTINAVPEPLSVKSSSFEIVLVNDAFCETHDVLRERVIGKTAEEALPRSHSPEVKLHEKQVLESGEKQAAFEAFVDVNHEQFILSTYRSTFRDQASDESYVVAVSRDVTAEMKRENRLQLLASVFENAQEGVAILNPDGTICEANPEFIATVGKAHSQILGTTLEGLLDCGAHQFTEVISFASAGRPWFGNVKMLNKRGEEIACWLSLSPSKNRRGETTNLIAMFSDITQIEDTRKELHRQALHDNLTDLPNRRFFRQRIADLIASDSNGSVRFGVSFLDLDDFKIVNDTLGHDAGDHLLVEVSRRVKETLGPGCFMARFGGDEFALLIPERVNSPLQAIVLANAVVESLSQPFNLAGHEVHIGVSVGTTIYPDHAKDVESLMRHADVAMYKAKDEGKNKVKFFSTELVEAVEKRQRVLSELRVALDQEALTVVYQPKMCLRTNRIASSEALVRWIKPDGTMIPPSEFIPLAEDFGLINLLGQQVLRAVCLQARQWFDAGVLSGPIAVNLSPRQLKEQNFLQQLTETLNETGVDPSWIELEITENAVMEDVDRALKLMQKINQLGVSIAMDDFGTGYSSLSYIRDFPIRTLKIDTTFVRDLPCCSRAVAIAKTVLSLGHGLDLKVVAEGVETVEQLEFLREAGCDMVQGYLISRPLTAEKLLDWLKTL
jgi:diguanylate cyclase (GGDEF)-like protein/PAS domain S-box-containing protein